MSAANVPEGISLKVALAIPSEFTTASLEMPFTSIEIISPASSLITVALTSAVSSTFITTSSASIGTGLLITSKSVELAEALYTPSPSKTAVT